MPTLSRVVSGIYPCAPSIPEYASAPPTNPAFHLQPASPEHQLDQPDHQLVLQSESRKVSASPSAIYYQPLLPLQQPDSEISAATAGHCRSMENLATTTASPAGAPRGREPRTTRSERYTRSVNISRTSLHHVTFFKFIIQNICSIYFWSVTASQHSDP